MLGNGEKRSANEKRWNVTRSLFHLFNIFYRDTNGRISVRERKRNPSVHNSVLYVRVAGQTRLYFVCLNVDLMNMQSYNTAWSPRKAWEPSVHQSWYTDSRFTDTRKVEETRSIEICTLLRYICAVHCREMSYYIVLCCKMRCNNLNNTNHLRLYVWLMGWFYTAFYVRSIKSEK